MQTRFARAPQSFRLSFIVCCIAALGMAGCGGSDDGGGEAPQTYAQRCFLSEGPSTANILQLPAPTGSHCIGKTSFHLVDSTRPEPNTPEEADRRELSVKVWYPSMPSGSRTRAAYMDPAVATLVKPQFLMPANADPLTNAKPDASLSPGSKHPVVIFSPGYGGVVEAYSTILEDMASHGVIVVAIDHPYISAATALNSGQVALVRLPEDPTDAQKFEELVAAAAPVEIGDQRQVLDWLQGPGTGLLGGHLDLTRIGAYGHSFGGSGAIQAARVDERIKAAMDIDGTVLGDTSGPWSKPLMFLLAENHTEHPTIDAVLRNATGPHATYILKNAGHLDFSDIKLILNFYAPEQDLTLLNLGTIDAKSALQATREQTLAFFQQHLFP